jgi:hypothetical protein
LRSGALRNGVEALESRALLSGQAAMDALITPSSAAVEIQVATDVPKQSAIAVNQLETQNLNLAWVGRSDAAIVLKPIDTSRTWTVTTTSVDGTFYLGRGHHFQEAGGVATSNAVNVSFGVNLGIERPRILLAPFDGSFDFFLPPHGVRQLPGVAVDIVPDVGSAPGSAPGRPGGAILMSAVTAFTQAFATTDMMLLNGGVDMASIATAGVVDARSTAVTPNLAPNVPAVTAHARASAVSPLSGGADGGFVSVRAERAVDAESLDALLDTAGSEGLTAAELDWLGAARNDELIESLTPRTNSKDATSLAVVHDSHTESSDEGMTALSPVSAEVAERSQVAAVAAGESAIEIAAAASMFQAFDFGFDAPQLIAPNDGGRDVTAAFVTLESLGEAKEPSELTALFCQRLFAGAVIGLVCVEYVRRRKERDGNGEW